MRNGGHKAEVTRKSKAEQNPGNPFVTTDLDTFTITW